MKPFGLKFDGRVIEELSTKIPSNIFALNELTKNAYDAFAKNIIIKVDRQASELIIIDDGKGMDEQDVKKLLHIANSTKKYGAKKKFNELERYTQGSKGLGFLSVFKFGNRVTWTTYNSGSKIEFTIEKSDIISKRNAARFKVPPLVTSEPGKGTTISIQMDEKEIEIIDTYLQEEKHAKKIVNSFYDSNVNIRLQTTHGEYATEEFDEVINRAENDQFCFVEFDSKKSKIEIYRLQNLIKNIDFKLQSNAYTFNISLMIYHFNPGRKKIHSGISNLFYRETDEALTPLLYINDNLFNNYQIFDSNVNRAKKSGEAMPQMTGYVRVYCSDSGLEFNSDRTNFVENDLTRKIKSDLIALNQAIQKAASQIKDEEKKKYNSKEIRTGKAKPKENTEKDTSTKSNGPSTAKINLKIGIPRRYQVPSRQIDLRNFVGSIFDSTGENVSVDEIKFELNGEIVSPVVSSIRKEDIREYNVLYNDKDTGEVIESLKIEFYTPKASISGNSKKGLFILSSNKSYSVSIPTVANLITQISDIHTENPDYYEVIACSLRAILEISIESLKLKQASIFNHQRPSDDVYNDLLLWNVVQLVHFLKNNKSLRTKCAKILEVSYHSFNNFLDINSYKSSVKKAHLGAHKSAEWLTPDDIKSLAHRAGHLAVICDVIINHVDDSLIKNATIASYP